MKGVRGLYLGKKCMKDLGVITKNFPCVGYHLTGRENARDRVENNSTQSVQETELKEDVATNDEQTDNKDF